MAVLHVASSALPLAACSQTLLRGIATFALARSRSADIRDLLWAAGENPKAPLPSHQPHLPHHELKEEHMKAKKEAAVRAGAALSTRDAVARCASRLSYSLAPGTPSSYEGALQPSSQARVVTEPFPPFRVVHVNRAWEQLCGWRASEVVGETMSILQGPDTDPGVIQQIRRAAVTASRTQMVCVNYRKDGSKFINRLQVSPLYNYSGSVSHLLGVLTPAPQDAWQLPNTRHAAGPAAAAQGSSSSDEDAAAARVGEQ